MCIVLIFVVVFLRPSRPETSGAGAPCSGGRGKSGRDSQDSRHAGRPAGATMGIARDYRSCWVAGRQDRAGRRLPLTGGARTNFGSVQAVRGVTLAIGSGEVIAFLGPNGAGKTSTIDMILGLSHPTAGAVEVYGMAPRQAVRKGLVSAVMQAGGLLKDLTVAETAQYTVSLFAASRPVGEVLERAGITAIAGRMVASARGESNSGCASPWR